MVLFRCGRYFCVSLLLTKASFCEVAQAVPPGHSPSANILGKMRQRAQASRRVQSLADLCAQEEFRRVSASAHASGHWHAFSNLFSHLSPSVIAQLRKSLDYNFVLEAAFHFQVDAVRFLVSIGFDVDSASYFVVVNHPQFASSGFDTDYSYCYAHRVITEDKINLLIHDLRIIYNLFPRITNGWSTALQVSNWPKSLQDELRKYTSPLGLRLASVSKNFAAVDTPGEISSSEVPVQAFHQVFGIEEIRQQIATYLENEIQIRHLVMFADRFISWIHDSNIDIRTAYHTTGHKEINLQRTLALRMQWYNSAFAKFQACWRARRRMFRPRGG